MPENLHIDLFGGFSLKYNGEQIANLDSPRLQQILAYLILNRNSRQSRQYLAFQLWPNSSEKQALANLRNQLHQLHNVFPEAKRYLSVDHKSLQWNTQVASISDIAKFETYITKAKQIENGSDSHLIIKSLKKAISLYKGPLLPEFYEDWIEHHRVRLKLAYESALQELIELLERKKDFKEAIYYTKKYIQQDPLNETAWRWLMELYANNNNRASALQTYRECANVLREEFDVRPSKDTTEVYNRLLSGFNEEIDIKSLDNKTIQDNLVQKRIDQYQKEETESIGSASEYGAGKKEIKFNAKKTKNKIPFLYSGILFTVLLLLVVGYYFYWESQTEIDSIAVLPFENLSGHIEQEYFVDGMTEALTSELVQINDLKVISRTSAMTYKNTTKSIPDIARELDVDALIEGSVRQAGNTVEITFQLIHGPTDEHLWSNSYQRELQNILSLQNEVARDIADEIKLTFGSDKQDLTSKKESVNPEAYRLWLKGNFQMTQLNDNAFQWALDYYQEAIEIEPNYPQAYAGLALTYILKGSWHGLVPPSQVFPKAKEAANQALTLDSTVADAHIALARIQHLYEWDWEGAEIAYQRGIELSPSNTFARILYANFQTSMGRFQESIKICRRILEIDPLSAAVYNELGFAHWHSGNSKKALELIKEGLQLNPDFIQSHVLIALVYLTENNFEKAIMHMQKVNQGNEQVSSSAMGFKGFLYGKVGLIKEARSILSYLNEVNKRSYVPPAAFAYVYIGLGEYDDALSWLEKAYEVRDVSLVWIKVNKWMFDYISNEPRFQSLLNRMNFPD